MLRGEKVILRAIKREDIQRRFEFENDVAFHTLHSEEPWEPRPLARIEAEFEERAHKDDREVIPFAIEADGQYIGHCLLYGFNHMARRCSLGIGIGNPAYQGRGYGRDALRVLLDYAFRLRNLRKVSLTVSGDNERAIRSYRACGFVEEGRLRQHDWTAGEYIDVICMSLLRDEWQAQQHHVQAAPGHPTSH
jgi:RimJ/RimL family protein N-acetyltransferase